ncbi:alpha/beta hydrolase [Nocardioides sp. GY 10113]|uniref:alpha/beta hydrolase n=1 Tax=Nocardioides sp. GY 10113 TaxID=2569761 RepID=UPI0010A80C5B|nr:alpha/beta hydrolase [Nocardioides sp. GY 10113]TIC86755.1 alpha/beta hydrolase [Nocardioides sp. GY 10113]
MTQTALSTLSFTSEGVTCAADHYPARTDALATAAGRPVMVMAHGLSCTRDTGLAPFAEAFADAGIDVLTFDYRGFGTSGGEPRQVVSLAGQLADLRAAMAAAASLEGVDPDRIVLWGDSLGGGHVISAAVDRPDVAAVVAVVPMVDGLAAARLAARHHAPGQLVGSTLRGLRSKVGVAVGRERTMIPVVARPGEVGALTVSGALEDLTSIAGPTWRNEIAADVVLELGGRQPAKDAARLTCPWLVQIADFDRSAPPHAAAKAAFAGRAEVRHYPGDHFDLFPGKPCHDAAVRHAVTFLTRHLAPAGD